MENAGRKLKMLCIKHIKFTIFHLMHEQNTRSIFMVSLFRMFSMESIGDGNQRELGWNLKNGHKLVFFL